MAARADRPSPRTQPPSADRRAPAPDTGEIVELRDGTRALIRPIEAGDRERLNEGFGNASAESIFMRFLSPVPRLSGKQLEFLTSVDHVRHEAVIAVDPQTGQSFGTARYVRSDDDPQTAEFAIGVGDRWMRIGLGTALLGALLVRAREAGVVRLTGVVHPHNNAIKGLLGKVAGHYEMTSSGAGEQEVAVDLRDLGDLATGGRP